MVLQNHCEFHSPREENFNQELVPRKLAKLPALSRIHNSLTNPSHFFVILYGPEWVWQEAFVFDIADIVGWSFRVNRVSPGLILLCFFGTLIGLAVLYGIKRSFEPKRAPTVVAEKPQRIILASTDLPIGRTIRNSDFVTIALNKKQFESRKWPVMMMAEGKQLIGRTLRQPVKKGQPFEPELFYPEGTGPNVADRLGPGMRAVPVQISTSGIPVQATPGNFVDVIFRSDASKDESLPELTSTLISGVEILAIGDNITVGMRATLDRKAEFQTVILAVTSEQAMRLKVIEGKGVSSLTLRSEIVATNAEEEPQKLTLADVLDLPPVVEPVPPPEEPPPLVSEVFRRGKRQVTLFSADGMTRVDRRLPKAKVEPLRSNTDYQLDPAFIEEVRLELEESLRSEERPVEESTDPQRSDDSNVGDGLAIPPDSKAIPLGRSVESVRHR